MRRGWSPCRDALQARRDDEFSKCQGLRMNDSEEFETEVEIERSSAAFAAQAQLAGMIPQDFDR